MYPLPKPVSNKQVNYIHVPEYRNHVAVINGDNGFLSNLDSRQRIAIVVGIGALLVGASVGMMLEKRKREKTRK